MSYEDEALKLENQLCFPLYACSKEIVRKYKPLLDPLDLTYTQYITMMVMWEKKKVTVKELGDALYLDSGTLTPVLKKMESKGLVLRNRSNNDERVVIITITEQGEELKKRALAVPALLGSCLNLNREESIELHRLLHKLLNKMV